MQPSIPSRSASNLNTCHAAYVSKQTASTNFHKIFKNVTILEINDHYEKLIQTSTDMAGIGSLICEKNVKISAISSNKTTIQNKEQGSY